MAANPLSNRLTAPPPRLSQQEICDEGNTRIAALPRHDIHWYLHDGRATLGFSRPPSLRVVGR